MIAFAKPPGTHGVRTADDLLAEFRATGAQAPFEELVRRYAAMVFTECYAVTKSKHDAEDAAQAAFLTLAVQARTGEEIRHLGPWLQRVARRVALDQEKAKRRRKKREDNHHRVNGTTGYATSHTESLDQLELRHMISEELQHLPAKYRMPLVLHYFGGLSREQMAGELKCKPATLGVRLFRAREMLGKRLAKRGMVLPAAMLPLGIAMVVRESVEQHGVMAMAASAAQIAEAAARVAAGLKPTAGCVSAGAMALAETAAHDLVLRRLRGIIAAAAIGASALVAGGAQVVHKIADGTLSIPALFDLNGYFRSLTLPGVPELRVDASEKFDSSHVKPADWPSALASNGGDFSFELSTVLPQAPMALRGVPGAAAAVPNVTMSAVVQSTPTFRRTSGPKPVELAQGTKAADCKAATAVPVDGAASGTGGGDHSDAAPALVEGVPTKVEEVLYASTSLGGGGLGGSGFENSGETFVIRPVPPLSSMARNYAASSSLPFGMMSSGPQTTRLAAQGNVLRGFGSVAIKGDLDMSGVVIADGGSQPRTLDFSSVTTIYNSVSNPPTGINGWYAQNQGKLTLPAINLAPGTSTVAWGDNLEDGRLDLVNSMKMTMHNVRQQAALTISLLAPDRQEVPTLPKGYEALTIWSLAGGAGLDYDSMSVAVRYALPGTTLAGPLSGLGMFWYDGSTWHSADSVIDPSTRLISAAMVPPTDYLGLFTAEGRTDVSLEALGLSADGTLTTPGQVLLDPSSLTVATGAAVGAPVFSSFVTVAPDDLRVRSFSVPTGVVPEAGGMVWLLGGLPILLRRRR